MAAQLIQALKEAEDLEQLESNWAVKQNVEEAIKFLHQVNISANGHINHLTDAVFNCPVTKKSLIKMTWRPL